MFLSLDTNVAIAATVGEPDRLNGAWLAFDARELRKRFIARAVADEFFATVEGVGGATPGIVSEIISDALTSIRTCHPARPDPERLDTLHLGDNRMRRVLRLLDLLAEIVGPPWDSVKVRGAIRDYERQYAVRKQAFFSAHPIYDTTDPNLVEGFKTQLLSLRPIAGRSWQVDCLILAQVATVIRERQLTVDFVTEDRRHMGRLTTSITGLTGIARIRDMGGSPL